MVKYKYGVEKLLSLKSKPAMPSKFSTPVPGLDFYTTPHPFLREYSCLYFLAANVFSDDSTLLLYTVTSTHKSTGSSLYVKCYLPHVQLPLSSHFLSSVCLTTCIPHC